MNESEKTPVRKLEEAGEILKALQVPEGQQTELCRYVLLSLAGLGEGDPWNCADNQWIRIHDIIAFTREHYGVRYAENSRETIRKQALHHFRNAAFVEDNGRATNSPNYRYRLTEELLTLVRSYGSGQWTEKLSAFLDRHKSLTSLYSARRSSRQIPVSVNAVNLTFSTGGHNLLQKAVLEEFVPRFAPDAVCLYVGDTAKRDLVKDETRLRELGFEITLHDKMPDIVLYSSGKNWLYFIECVTSVGPMEPKRVIELAEMTKGVSAGRIYVTAFPDFRTFKRFSQSLAWETEVWIADAPDHMIHLNGDRFLGPR